MKKKSVLKESKFPENKSSDCPSYQQDFEKLLKKLLQFDVPDLDFGIYRFLNQKKDQLNYFITDYLPNLLDSTINEAVRSIPNISIEPNHDPIKKEIFEHIITFFSRYYCDGDFLPQHRYTQHAKYSVPYNGEETFFYWANQDQYYIKTEPYLQNYRFKFNNISIHFQLVEALLESTNVKLAPRFFLLVENDPISWNLQTELLTITFTYRFLNTEEQQKWSGKAIQTQILDENCAIIWEYIMNSIEEFGSLLNSTEKELTENQFKDLLLQHLQQFTARNSRDFFIHKNLREFLSQELEFFIKNELLSLNNLAPDESPQAISNFLMISSFQQISRAIIEILAEIEQFQKSIWEMKKQVIQTEYLATIDLMPESLISEIAHNERQIQEWNTLYALDLDPQNSERISGFIQAHPSLMVDTANFPLSFKDQLIATFDDLDEQINGVVVKSESFQAMNLLQNKYHGRMDCFYLDPPYNTGEDEFLYKDNYRHSSWLSMMGNLLPFLGVLGKGDVNFFISIDDNELSHLTTLMEQEFGADTLLGPIIVQSNKGGRDYLPLAKTHEYIVCGTLDPTVNTLNELSRDTNSLKFTDSRGLFEVRELRNRNPKFSRENRPNLFYSIFVDPNNPDSYGFCPVSLTALPSHSINVEPKNQRGVEGCWRWGSIKLSENIDPADPSASEVVARQRADGGWNIYEKYRKETTKPKSIWDETGVRTENGTIILGQLFGQCPFNHPKPVDLVEKCIQIGSESKDWIMDFFAGSGTTAHAVLLQNLESDAHRKYILVEMGQYFDTVLLPRIKKVVYTMEWEEGRPRDPINLRGQTQLIKVLRLEQYEDLLNNIQISSPDAFVLNFEKIIPNFNHFLELEQALNWQESDLFQDPFHFNQKIHVSIGLKETAVDLVETFNLLLGLQVKQIQSFEQNDRRYQVIFGNHEGKSTIIIWRSCENLDLLADRVFIEETIVGTWSPREIFINGQFSVKNAQAIESVFKKLVGA